MTSESASTVVAMATSSTSSDDAVSTESFTSQRGAEDAPSSLQTQGVTITMTTAANTNQKFQQMPVIAEA